MPFRERLNIVLNKRPLTTWGKTNKLSNGTIGRISGGIVPGHKILNIIQKIENVSLGWLIDGVGQPFMVADFSSDWDITQHLRALLAEPGWRIDMLTAPGGSVVVLTQPGQVLYKNLAIDYTITEITTGPIGRAAVALLNRHGDKHLTDISDLELSEIESGRVGSYRLGELLKTARPIGEITAGVLTGRGQIAEPVAEYEIDIMARYNRLTAHNQQSINLIIDTLLEGQTE